MKQIQTYLVLIVVVFLFSCQREKETAGNHGFPKLILQKSVVPEIVDGLEKFPLLKTSFEEAKAIAEKGIEAGILVPFPKDPGGGYTHEKHKQNYLEMYSAGLVYQLTGKEKYAEFVKSMLQEYAKLYPTLGLHPMQKNQSPGKLFWQGLNESVWLVYTIQAYDCIYDFLSEDEKEFIEDKLFRKVVSFFTVEDSYSFDRVHNHGTWAVAGVGMTGMVLDDSLLVQKALYSTKLDGSGGFLKQIDELFSPDGYYAEGPYYQRYALMPFILFAQALENNKPELKIFEYRDGLLPKAVSTILQLTNTDGKFYPINDAIKEKSWLTPELVFGTNIIYSLTKNNQLLDVAQKQGKVMLSKQGLEVAKAINGNETEKFKRIPLALKDGAKGDQGGLAVLRLGDEENQTSVLFKYSSQGMGHGHFDRLGIQLYDNNQEVIPDYGAARFLNVAAKQGGRYLPENKTWAKQTVAHNTMVINGESNFNGNLKKAEKNSPHLIFMDFNDSIQIISATDSNCYEGVILNRTLALFEKNERKYVIDHFNIENNSKSDYDMPVYFVGQLIQTNFEFEKMENVEALGTKNGYQHLWLEGSAKDLPETSSITWMNGTRFYTMSTITDANTEVKFVRLGANDPEFNLRNQQGFILSRTNSDNLSVLSVYEIHGDYNPASEAVVQSEGSVKDLSFQKTKGINSIHIDLKDGSMIQLGFSKNGNYKLINN